MHYVYLLRNYCIPFYKINVPSHMLFSKNTQQKRVKKPEPQKFGLVYLYSFLLFNLYVLHETDWSLYLDIVESIFCLFYLACHHNYTWDGVYYLNSMQGLPENAWDHILREKQYSKKIRCVQQNMEWHGHRFVTLEIQSQFIWSRVTVHQVYLGRKLRDIR